MKSNEAFPCVKPNVKSLKSSGLPRDPSRRIAFERPVIFAQTLAIISISSVSSLQCSRTEFRRALAACFPPSIPWCMRSSLNWTSQTSFNARLQILTIIPSPSIKTIMYGLRFCKDQHAGITLKACSYPHGIAIDTELANSLLGQIQLLLQIPSRAPGIVEI